MAGFVKQFVGHEYISTKLSGAVAIKVGAFVNVDLANSEYDIPAGDALGKVAMVCNEFDPLVPHNYDEALATVAGGDYVKGKPVLEAEEYVTTEIGSVYANIAKGTELGVGVDGKVYLLADLTGPAFTTFKTTFIVREKVKLWNLDALVLVANVK